MGLENSEHIQNIVVDPRNSSHVYVTAIGPLWSPGGDRGLYKTTDGGQTWKAILSISPDTGVTDMAMDPRNPDVLEVAGNVVKLDDGEATEPAPMFKYNEMLPPG